jgi:hypothetical protein
LFFYGSEKILWDSYRMGWVRILKNTFIYGLQIILTIIVPDGKGQGQPACQKEWKKCEEENEL